REARVAERLARPRDQRDDKAEQHRGEHQYPKPAQQGVAPAPTPGPVALDGLPDPGDGHPVLGRDLLQQHRGRDRLPAPVEDFHGGSRGEEQPGGAQRSRMSCESPLGRRTLRKEWTTTGKAGGSRGEEQPAGAQRSRMSCESPLGRRTLRKEWTTTGKMVPISRTGAGRSRSAG